MYSVINWLGKGLVKLRSKSYTLKSESWNNFWLFMSSLRAVPFRLLPFWCMSLAAWWGFLLSPWPKESLHGENDSSRLSVFCRDSVLFPELWSWYDLLLLLPTLFVTLKDIIIKKKYLHTHTYIWCSLIPILKYVLGISLLLTGQSLPL